MASTQLYVLSTPKQRGQNFTFYAFNQALELQGVTIYAASTKPAAQIASKFSRGTFVMVKGANINKRDNKTHVKCPADTVKVCSRNRLNQG